MNEGRIREIVAISALARLTPEKREKAVQYVYRNLCQKRCPDFQNGASSLELCARAERALFEAYEIVCLEADQWN